MPISIMAVDDSEAVLKSFEWILEDEPCRVFAFNDPLEALSLLNAAKFPIVVAEHHMRKMDGIEFLKKVMERSPQTIGILMTGYTEFVAALDSIYPNCIYKYVKKPFNSSEVRKVVRMAITQHELNSEKDRKSNSFLEL